MLKNTDYINKIAQLIANITESYSALIFVADEDENSKPFLRIAGSHTLSRELISDCNIPWGSGLIGWTAENGVRISVCPFENDSSTLLYYSKDQLLKSFIAIPIITEQNKVLGVIACDSKKSYAYAKMTEKILFEFADLLLNYLNKKPETNKPLSNETVSLEKKIINKLKTIRNEDELLKQVSMYAKNLLECETLVVLTSAISSYPARFYCSEGDRQVQHHLMELVCRQKKILCGVKSVQAKSSIEPNAKSFLSVPFRVMDKEAGSFNLLGFPGQAFSANQIASLENVALIVGEQLEKIRLRQRAEAFSEIENLVSWNHFLMLGKDLVNKANKNNESLALSRISIGNIEQLETLIGLGGCQELVAAVFRLIQQLIRQPAISCRILGTEVLLIAEKSEVDSMNHRLRKLLAKLDQNKSAGKPAIADLVNNGLRVTTVLLNRDGKNLEELLSQVQKRASSNFSSSLLTSEKQKAIA